MTRLLALAFAAIDLGVMAPQQPPTFRTSVDLVTIDVSVRANNLPVNGLTASDFSLTDNGVRQELKALSTAAVPIDLTLIMDVRGTFAGHLEQFQADVLEMTKLLRSADRIRLLTTGTVVKEVASLQQRGARPPVERMEPDPVGSGGTAFHDALVAALVRPVEPDRRHLVIAFGQSSDGLSVTTAQRLLAVAQRMEAVLHIVTGSTDMRNDDWAKMRRPIYGEAAPRLQRLVAEAAEITGGGMHDATFRGSIVPPFKRIFEEYRQSYLLQYELRGVAREGRHDVAVTVIRPGRYNIRARSGYFIERPSR